MLQVVHMDVAKVDRDVTYVTNILEACCKYFRDMLQAFVQNVSSVSDYVAEVLHVATLVVAGSGSMRRRSLQAQWSPLER